MSRVRWSQGAPALKREVEAALAGSVAQLRDDALRRVWVLHGARGPILVKQFRVGSGRHSLRERWKARLGRAPAQREWRALAALHAAGLPVPEPLALGTLPDGDAVLAMEWVEGTPLAAALRAAPPVRRAIFRSLGETLAQLHRAGWVHGDLHAGNVLIAARGPVVLDWQRARRSEERSARRRDLAFLEYSLAGLTSRADRLRIRHARLGISLPIDDDSRHELRAAGDAAERRAREHARSRTRRSLREGRRHARIELGGARGMRLREIEPATLARLLAEHRGAALAHDTRLLASGPRASISAVAADGLRGVVKQTTWRGLGRALADALRGSAGQRGWVAGHGLLARRIGVARPLAFLERRRFGVPIASWLVLEDLRPAAPAAFALERGLADADEVLGALAGLLVELHRAGVDHGDLKATNVLLRRAGGRLEPALVDLEAMRFRRRLSDARRLAALAELNASLPDAFAAGARRAAFERYARALPFATGPGRALAQLVDTSLARRHRWTGADCELARR